ncbi:MAG: hypothetical protein LBM39_00915 [Candidatus Methanoplasma sp.]|nr:hypothetical protein [Candidatus Methanoplasma sp.]
MSENKLVKARTTVFPKLYATNVLLSETDSDTRIYAFNETFETDEGQLAVAEGAIILTDQATVLLYEQLKSMLEKWESEGKKVIVSEKRRSTLKNLRD